MNCIRIPTMVDDQQIIPVPPEESAPLLARLRARARWLEEARAAQAHADAEHARRIAEAQEAARRKFWSKDKPAKVHHINEGSR